MRTTPTAIAVSIACLATACSSGHSTTADTTTSSGAPYTVSVDPATFSADVTNPWFPLIPGTTLLYRGSKDDQPARETYEISDETQVVDGVRCRVVKDRLYLSGVLAETTRDYYAQDRKGTVWYFGEDTATLEEDGSMIETAGTFHAGEAGAQPGIVMTANPQVGESHRQEYYKGYAEDFFEVLRLSVPVTVPYKAFPHALLTKEWTPLEPDVVDNKYIVKGIGVVREVGVKGSKEELVLVDVQRS